MTARVSLSPDAQAIVDFLQKTGSAPWALEEARRYYRRLNKKPSEKKRTARATTRAAKASKRSAKNAETAEIRKAVFERARRGPTSLPTCDYCHVRVATDLEHPFGRVRVKQSVETCLAVCRGCHDRRTRLVGGAVEWWKLIAQAFRSYSLFHSAKLAEDIAAKHEAKAEISEGTR